MDPFITIQRSTLADVLRHVSRTEDVNAIREADGSDEAEAHRRNCEGARELEQRLEAGTIGDVSVDGALETLIRDVLEANA